MRDGTICSTLAVFGALMFPSASLAQTPPIAPPGSVTLPLAEYDKLVDRAARPPVPPEPPPVAAVVARADLQVHASATDLRGTITLQGEVLREGRVKVPILAGATIVEVQQGASPVAVVNESGLTSAILSGPGAFTLTVSFGSDVATEPGRASATLPAVRAGTVHATIDAPGDNADVRVDRGLVGGRSSAAGKTVVDVTLEPGMPSRVSWSSRDQAMRTLREVRLTTDVKTLVTVAEGDLRLASVFDVNVLQGQPEQIDLQVPEGFEVVSVSGGSVETTGQQGARVSLAVRDASRRRYQFLVTLERASASLQHVELAVPGVQGTQRETGEIAWQAVGTVDLTAVEAGPLRRLDVTEVNPSLSSLARSPLLAAFRYQRRGDERVPVAFDVRRFADAPVLGAVAQDATVTTLVSSEGRALTEFDLTVRNRGQLFLKVGLPKGATLLSAEVGGEAVKPVEAADGARVPLVRPGYQPTGAYRVSFAYVEAGTTFDRKGEAEMRLPRVDVPIAVLSWEVFLPERYGIKRFEGDAMPASLLERAVPPSAGGTVSMDTFNRMSNLSRDQVGGVVVDSMGAVLPGVNVTVTQGSYRRTAVTGPDGTFLFSGMGQGRLSVSAELQGFVPYKIDRPSPGSPMQVTMQVGNVAETVQVTGEKAMARPQAAQPQANAPSQNVINLQQRVSGVLPVRIDIPRTGQSFRFVRPLVLEEETALRFQYKMR